jgi:hypothetical protein
LPRRTNDRFRDFDNSPEVISLFVMPRINLRSQFETSKISLRKLKVVEIASCRLDPSHRRAEWLDDGLC